jgi:thiamine biosynthesis lipoprotein
MGTTYHIEYVADSSEVNSRDLHTEVEQLLADVDRQMSTYRPDSELSRFNRAPSHKWFPVSAATAKVVSAAQRISERTSGAMDVTVGPLVHLWHFGPTSGANDARFAPPTHDQISVARRSVGYRNLQVRTKPPALRKEVDGLEVDLSSIAPGYTVDELSRLLAKHDLVNFMVEIGGEVRAHGKREDGTPWRIGIERPSKSARELQDTVPLVNAAIATAGDYRKFFEHDGLRYSHVIDPSTGRPVQHSLASVTVLADSCIEADGWDTPLLVLGPDLGYQAAERNRIAALFITRRNGGYDVRTTPAWRSRQSRVGATGATAPAVTAPTKP